MYELHREKLYRTCELKISWPSGSMELYIPDFFLQASIAQIRGVYKLLFTNAGCRSWGEHREANLNSIKLLDRALPEILGTFDGLTEAVNDCVAKQKHAISVQTLAVDEGSGKRAKELNDLISTLQITRIDMATLQNERKRLQKTYDIYKTYRDKYRSEIE